MVERAQLADSVEVRLLGPLRVWTRDGALVQDREWRTGKNADLLRWLALRDGDPVPVEVLADALWPDVGEAKARGSLRTAVSQLRRVLGQDSVERVSTGLALVGAWTDSTTFRELAEEVARHRREGEAALVLRSAREADALYLADLPLGEGTPEPLAEHAAALSALRRGVLADAAEAAVELGWMHDAVELGRRLLEVDPVSERASRVLMLGHAGLGEVHHALAEYERCRAVLAEELGADPSPQTRAVHLQVLAPPPSRTPTIALVGRRHELARLGGLLRPAAPTAVPPAVLLVGDDGSGRRRLAEEACASAGCTLLEVRDAAQGASRHDSRSGGDLPGTRPQVLYWEPDLPRDADALPGLLQGDGPRDRPVLVALPCSWREQVDGSDRLAAATVVLDLPALLPEEVEELAESLLAGALSPGLLDELLVASAGLPGTVTGVLRSWSSSGRLVATSSGLALAPVAAPRDDDPSGRRALVRALPRLEGDALEALLLAAVLDQPMTPTLLASVLVDAADDLTAPRLLRARAAAALDRLVDAALLRSSPAGAVWRHPLLRDAVNGWLRPVVRQRLHRRVAGQALVSSAVRVDHWLRAGERELACVAALEAADECLARGDHAGARAHLLQLQSLGDLPEADIADRLGLFEVLGDACALLRRPEEAAEAYQSALDLALEHLLPDSGRLRRKLEGSVTGTRMLEVAGVPGEEQTVLNGLGVLPGTLPDAQLETLLRDAVAQADRKHDARGAIAVRLQLAAAYHLPRREFRAAHERVQQALALGPRPRERLRAVVVQHLPAVLGGAGATVKDALDEAARAAEAAGEERLHWQLRELQVLVAHDLGLPTFGALWAPLRDRVLHGPPDDLTPELATIALRVLVEREELDLALAVVDHLPLTGGAALVLQHLARMSRADLADSYGEQRHAADLLRSVVEGGSESGCTLLVPEAAARLVALEAAESRGEAAAHFDLLDESTGGTSGGPREEVFRRLARAAVRSAQGDHARALRSCEQAAALASRHGLQVLGARARRTRAELVRHQPRVLNLVDAERAGSAAREQ